MLASKLLAQCAINRGLGAHTAETIGMAQRGGCVVSHVRIGAAASPLIPEHAADLILAFEPAEAVRCLRYLEPGGAVVTNSRAIKPVTDSLSGSYSGDAMLAYLRENIENLTVVDGDAVCAACGSPKVLNLALLGAAAKGGVLGFTAEELCRVIDEKIPERFRALNKKAIALERQGLKRTVPEVLMKYEDLLAGIRRYGVQDQDLCMNQLGVPSDHIQENVLIAPWWEPAMFPQLGEVKYLSPSASPSVKVWDIFNKECGLHMTYIKTGIGAPVLMDTLLSLGVTPCKRVLFIGSVGALDADIGIGDVVIPEYSICGDGASRYIAADALHAGDVFGEKAYPDARLLQTVLNNTARICEENRVNYHIGRNFSIDTIFAQFAHIEEIIAMGCNVIEMETAVAFRAAKLAGISLAAIFSVSDNTITHKSLMGGRTEAEQEYRRFTRSTVFPRIILDTLCRQI